MAPKGVKRKRPCRVRGGFDPNDCDDNYEWFTFTELTNRYGRIHAFLLHGNELVPTRLRECVDELEYGILKKKMIKNEVRNVKGMHRHLLSRAKAAQRHEQHK